MCLCLSLLLAVAVEGRVVSTTDGRPVPRAVVVLQGLGSSPDVDSYIAQADGEGRFHVDDVAPGRYRASAQREGFGAAKTSPSFKVEAGQPVGALELRLVPLGTISGTVTDSDGDPLSRMRVEVLGYGYARGKRELELRGNTRTDDRGVYRVTGLAPGRYYVRVAGAGIRAGLTFLRSVGNQTARAFPDTYFPSAAEPESAAPLALAPGGEVAGVNVQVRTEESHDIRVKIAGASSAMVMFSISSPGGMGLGMTWRADRVFLHGNAGPGTYVVRAADREHKLSARQVVKVAGADVDVTLTLAPDLRIAGAVRLESGASVPPERMRVSLTSDMPFEAPVQPNRTFTFESLQAGAYRLGVTIPPGGYLKSVLLGSRELASPQVDLAADSGPLVIIVAGDGGTAEGTAVEGTAVALVPEGRRGQWPELVRWTFAGPEGKFELRDLAPGDYKLFAWEDAEPGAPLDPEFRRPFEARATAVRIAPHGKHSLDVKPF